MNRNSLNLALKQVSRQLCVPLATVELVYNSYWSFIRETIIPLSLKQLTKEEAEQITANFNIPFIGKLYLDCEQIGKYHRQLNYYQNARSKRN